MHAPRSYPLAKPQGTLRVAVLGSSVVYGLDTSFRDTIPGVDRTRAAGGRSPRRGAQLRHPRLHHRQRVGAAPGVRPPVPARRSRGRGRRPGRPPSLARRPSRRRRTTTSSSSRWWEALLNRGAPKSALLTCSTIRGRRAGGSAAPAACDSAHHTRNPMAAGPGNRRRTPRIRRVSGHRLAGDPEGLRGEEGARAGRPDRRDGGVLRRTIHRALPGDAVRPVLRPHRRGAGAYDGRPLPPGSDRCTRQRARRPRRGGRAGDPGAPPGGRSGSARVIDMLDASRRASHRNSPDFTWDGIHLSTAGNAAFGRTIARRILQDLDPGVGRRD